MRNVNTLMVIGIIILFSNSLFAQHQKQISEKELCDKLHGFWVGQLAGNYMGFPFENLYFEEPVPIFIDRYYNYNDLDSLDLNMNVNDRRAFTNIMAEALGGAWSDDDTDIEFVILHGVEKYGLDITYEEITEMWKKHINRFIWGSSREARDLMEKGMLPPATGSKEYNQYWWRITSQLINEIWSAFYPGMTAMARERASWGAHIVCDGWATHATEVYGVMYSAAFFEDDVNALVQMAANALPDDSPYKEGMHQVIQWYNEHPDDWRKTRQKIHESYYDEFGGFTIPKDLRFISAGLNGLIGIMAILYGQGDFLKTVGIATTAGYDCDNQAATCGGLIGIIHGGRAIPDELVLELPSRGKWEKPFNDQYINYSRDYLPNVNRISDIVNRIMAVSEEAIIKNGGEKKTIEGETFYVINSDVP